MSMRVRIAGSSDFMRALFCMLSAEIAHHLAVKRMTENAVLQDFRHWRKVRRKHRPARP
jgi:hypothetical protein